MEADIYYGAINENSKTKIYRPDYLNTFPDVFGAIWPDKAEFGELIRVFDVSEHHARLLLTPLAARYVGLRRGKSEEDEVWTRGFLMWKNRVSFCFFVEKDR